MKCPIISCRHLDNNKECSVESRAKVGEYNCKFTNCEHYSPADGVKHNGYKLSLIGDSSAELILNPKKFDLLTCYKLSEAFGHRGDMFSPAMLFEEIIEENN